MPSWVSEHSEPERKRNLLEKRLRRLRAAIKAGESRTRVSNEAEKVRLAALALIKAKRALIGEYPQRDAGGRQSRNLQDEEQRWLSLSTQAIVEEYGRNDA
jgi:hypothetical protein